MSQYGWHIDSFSTPIADLKHDQRTALNVLRCIAKNPRVSTFDMSEQYRWLPGLISACITRNWITEQDEPYPWHRYALTDAGREAMGAA